MRLGIDVSQVVYPGTGVKTYTQELIHSLLSLDKKNSYVLFGASLRKLTELKQFSDHLEKRVETKFVPIPPTVLTLLWNDLHFLPVDTFTGPIDVFHASDATQPPTKAKKVATVHDLVAYHFPETLEKSQVAIQKKRLAWVKEEADAIIAVSESTKRDLTTILEMDEKKIHVIYEGVSEKYSSSLRQEKEKLAHVHEKYKLPDTYLLYVGRLEPRKNLLRLMEAYAQIKHAIPLVIAGNVAWGPTFIPKARVHRIGYVKEEDLPYVYAGAYAFLYPALYEGFGLPILEALACGTPVVTSNTSSMPEIGGEACIYVDPHDTASIYEGLVAVQNLSQSQYTAMQQKSVKQAQKFSWEICAKQTLQIYTNLG